MSLGSLDEFIDATKQEQFEERPVPLDEFLYSEDFLDLPDLSPIQTKLVEALTQIFRYETLEELWGTEEADRLWKSTYKEIIAQLGKGSGKDFCTTVAFTRIVYLLLCLREPASYYGKPKGDSIDLLNVAINAKQAKNVFFSPFKQRIKNCPWFNGRYNAKADHIEFDKGITAHSGHSEREAWEGYNFIMVVLDEIAGFATEAETTGDNALRGKTAESIYRMYKASVSSRFPKFGKLALLSFPRFKGDFIQQRYDEVIDDAETKQASHTFKLHEDVADGVEGNEFTIEWDHDRIVTYVEPYVYALKRATWEVNPTIDIDDFKMDFWRDPQDSLSRFACMPPDAVDAFFKDKNKMDKAFDPAVPSPFHDDWSYKDFFEPVEGKDYFIHVDLGYSHDRAAIAMSHAKEWVKLNYGGNWEHWAPIVKLDAVRYWTPRSDQNVDFDELQKYIIDLLRKGFKIKLVTFDKWNSVGFRQRLKKDYGIETELLSVAKPHYEDLAVVINEERLKGYDLELARDELLGLKVIRGNKVDHTRKGSKDVADAIAGSVYNTVSNSHRDTTQTVEVRYLSPESPSEDSNNNQKQEPKHKPKMPPDLKNYLDRMEAL